MAGAHLNVCSAYADSCAYALQSLMNEDGTEFKLLQILKTLTNLKYDMKAFKGFQK